MENLDTRRRSSLAATDTDVYLTTYMQVTYSLSLFFYIVTPSLTRSGPDGWIALV